MQLYYETQPTKKAERKENKKATFDKAKNRVNLRKTYNSTP